ncbi:hypothetical protein [Sphingomonas sp. LR55]
MTLGMLVAAAALEIGKRRGGKAADARASSVAKSTGTLGTTPFSPAK